MNIVTAATLTERTCPAIVHWHSNTEHRSPPLATQADAVRFFLQLDEQQRPTAWIEFEKGPVMLFADIEEIAAG